MRRSRFSEEQIIGVLKEADAGIPVLDLCREHGLSEQTFYRWKKKYGGMDVREQAAQAAAGRGETRQPCTEGRPGKTLRRPSDRRDAVALMMAHGASQRRACRLAQINRNVLCYRPKLRPQDDRIRARLRELAEERRRFGYRRLYVLLRREGEPANRKRVYRIYREEKLMVRKRTRKRVAQARGRKRHAPSAPNQFWAMDFVSDVVAAGRRIPSLTVIDAYTRESLALEVDTSITGDRVVCVFEEIVERRGLREAIQVDNGPEFRGLVLDAWAYERSV